MASTAAPDHHRSRPIRLLAGIAAALACLLALGIAGGMIGGVRPRPMGHADTVPDRARLLGGAWYWVERPRGADARLMRLLGPRALPVATAHSLTDYAADDRNVAWIEQRGSEWRVAIAGVDGASPRVLWSGTLEPSGVLLTGDEVVWLAPRVPESRDCGPLPPFGPSMDLLAAPRSGGAPRSLAQLPGATGGQALGMHGGSVYVAAYRGLQPGSTTFYRIGAAGSVPERLAAEEGRQEGLLARDGTLFWIAASREATFGAGVCCIRCLKPGQPPETLSDWLPAQGMLVETARGVRYVDREPQAGLWPTGSFLSIPRSWNAPPGFRIISAGGDQMLLCPSNAWISATELYRVPVP